MTGVQTCALPILPCPEVVAVSYIRPAEVPTLFSVEREAQVEQQNTVVGFLTPSPTPPPLCPLEVRLVRAAS